MTDQHHRAGKFEQALLQDFERGDIQIVGGLIEQQHVGGGQHQSRDHDARALAAREPRDRHVELVVAKQEALGPSGDVDGAVAIDHHVAIRAQGAAQADVGVQVRAAVLRETDDLQAIGALDVPSSGSSGLPGS